MCLHDIHFIGNLTLPAMITKKRLTGLNDRLSMIQPCKGSIEMYFNNDNNILCILFGYDACMDDKMFNL